MADLISSYEWDDVKASLNTSKHGVHFVEVYNLVWDQALTREAKNENELRYVTIAPIERRLYVLVWTQRGNKIRVISLRKANNREVRSYEQATQQT